MTIQTYVQILLQQPDFDLSILDNLSKHLQKARKDANAWNLNILPGLIKITADIIDYANTFQSFQDVLVKFAGELSVPDSKKKLIEGLMQLHNGILEKHDTAQAVQTQMNLTLQQTIKILHMMQRMQKQKFTVAVVKLKP